VATSSARRHAAAAPVKHIEQASLRGSVRVPSWGGALGAAPASGVLQRWAQGAWAHRLLPRRGATSISMSWVGGTFGGGCERATGGRMVLVGADDVRWMCRSWSSAAGLGWRLWSSSLVVGAWELALSDGRRWSRCSFLLTGGGLRWLGLGRAAPPIHP
jgi:hypothetical protein